MHHSISWKKAVVITFLIYLNGILLAQPIGYYNGTENLSGEQLKSALHEIINDHVDFSYSRVRDIINYSDADPNNPNNVILFYTQESRNAAQYGSGGDYINREHVWAKSHGYFEDIRSMNGDAQNLRPADASVNEDRGNKDFDDVQPNGTRHPEATECWYSSNAWEPGPLTKGQVARILFYMATRYEGENGEIDLELVDKLSNYPLPQFGKLSTLLKWNNEYPPSDFERRRNERIYEIQQNRNPFVDNPDFANLIWNNGSLKNIKFSEFEMTPEKPAIGEDATISVGISSSTAPDSVLLFWGNTYDSNVNKAKMPLNSGKYSAQLTFNNVEAGETVYFLIQAFSGEDTANIRGSYIFPETISEEDLTQITDVQGTTLQSPLLGQEVTIAGRIAANFDNAVYIQQKGTTKRAGICVYNSLKTGNIGDSIIVKGTVAEYSSLTELADINYFVNFKNNDSITPQLINTQELGEDLEGMLVTIENVTFKDAGVRATDANTSFTFSDDYGESVLFSAWNSRLVGKKIPSGKVKLTGVVSEYNGSYQILARDINDFSSVITSAPLVSKSKNEVTIYPNPAGDQLNFSTTEEISSVEIFSANGQLKQQIKNPATSINTSGLTDGIYFITITTDENELIHKKFVISR
ncbi:endonuclease [Prolixibacteraceae bacterium Z1-6]|uniref:Endonuclease n=1 Tax=Draconibacterium aestuarii TaxID=2998507 RepID=A0A9X3J7K6_9BACT|nr:endonuclease [Prolixibacteraceae bacterium Z1-6]